MTPELLDAISSYALLAALCAAGLSGLLALPWRASEREAARVSAGRVAPLARRWARLVAGGDAAPAPSLAALRVQRLGLSPTWSDVG